MGNFSGYCSLAFGNSGGSCTKKSKSVNRADITDEVEEIVNKVETIKQFHALEKKLEKLEERMDEQNVNQTPTAIPLI
ncbi:hypothetical protein MNBD_GAMMA07-1104 [hydrothermal vent metagenome]|uniref:Uncharacterized protein n=1 Tax=hydrothermal vent metagenome TaxID=652676 RepID=A0A3B0WU03_9ZZZZ